MNDLYLPACAAALRPADAIDEIFGRAALQKLRLGLRYAGAVTPPEAWRLVQAGAAQLIDVRTGPEFNFVGHAPGSTHVEWQGRDDAPRASFLRGLAAAASPALPWLFICRSGVRSHAAADAACDAGYASVYNVLEGFEGRLNHDRQRGRLDGWRWHGLPWEQD